MVFIKKEELIKENKILKEEIEHLKEELNQYKKENIRLEEKYDNYKKLGRKQYNDCSVIKLMYDLYINENKSFKQIADILNHKGIKTKLNKSWGKSSVSCILKNENNLKDYLNDNQYNNFIELLESNKNRKTS